MSEPVPGVELLPHAVFLRRLAATAERSVEARLGRAAFVALRLVDLLAEQAVPAVAFHYQHGATERACQGLPADCTETGHVKGVVASAADAFQTRDTGLLFPALFAYAHFLEDELRLEEALDVLQTLQQVTGEVLPAEDKVAARLRTARVLRKLNRFDEAEGAYEEAGSLAAAARDGHSELLSRIGRAEAVRGRGNLGEAERSLRRILADAVGAQDVEAEALCHHVLAAALSASGQPQEAIPHVWSAFHSYNDQTSKGRALADLGGLFVILGDTIAAERALGEAVRRGGSQDFATNALIELMNSASFRGDRVGFERWREECEARSANMPPNLLVDFTLKTAIGRARFGQMGRASAVIARARQLAEAAGLHEFVFRIERIASGLHECHDPLAGSSAGLPQSESAAVREVSASLAHLEE